LTNTTLLTNGNVRRIRLTLYGATGRIYNIQYREQVETNGLFGTTWNFLKKVTNSTGATNIIDLPNTNRLYRAKEMPQ